MNRFFVHKENILKDGIVIDNQDDFKHITKVLRLKKDDEIMVCATDGFEYTCKISEIDKGSIYTIIEDKNRTMEEDKISITLFQGLPKSSKMEYIIQKTIELGVDRISPIIMDRSIDHSRGKNQNKQKRYVKIAEAAAKQAQRGYIPSVDDAESFSTMVNQLKDYDLVVFPYENEDEISIKDYLRNMDNIKDINNIALIIGPEGGFSQKEVDRLTENGIKPVSLGKSILRTETAGIVAIAMINYELNL